MRVFAVIFLLSLTSIHAQADVPNVVTDIPAVHSLVKQVMGDLADPALLVKTSADPHHFQLRPSQARSLANADVVFWVGEELTPWLARSFPAISMNGRSVALIDVPGTTRIETSDHDAHGVDPHAWLDPDNAIIWLDVIAQELSKVDPANSTTYEENAVSAKTEISSLTKMVAVRLAETAPHNILVAHNALAYFSDRFGVNIVGVVSDHEGEPPNAAHLRDLQNLIRGDEVQCAFREPGQSPTTLEMLIDGMDIKLGILDPTGTMLEPGADLYGDLIVGLADVIANCKTP